MVFVVVVARYLPSTGLPPPLPICSPNPSPSSLDHWLGKHANVGRNLQCLNIAETVERPVQQRRDVVVVQRPWNNHSRKSDEKS